LIRSISFLINIIQELKCDKEKIPSDATPAGYKSYWLSGDTGKSRERKNLIRTFPAIRNGRE